MPRALFAPPRQHSPRSAKRINIGNRSQALADTRLLRRRTRLAHSQRNEEDIENRAEKVHCEASSGASLAIEPRTEQLTAREADVDARAEHCDVDGARCALIGHVGRVRHARGDEAEHAARHRVDYHDDEELPEGQGGSNNGRELLCEKWKCVVS